MSAAQEPRGYRLLYRTVLRRIDAERAHHGAFALIRLAGRVPGLRSAVRARYAPPHPTLAVNALGMRLPGPFGLAAGFDKNAVGIRGLAQLGFDFVEIGTVTGQPQPGNPTPRLFRITADRALVNRMGFNNDGSAAVAARLAALGADRPPLGVNIGKTKAVPETDAIDDYVTSTERLARHADYLVVNVSSPNTPGLRDLQATERLRPLLTAVRAAADHSVTGRRVPLLVKIAPDLADEDLDRIADLAVELGLDGIIATNTTTARDGLRADSRAVAALGPGGLSGAPLKERSLAVLRRLYARVGDRVTLVGVGGVETADDVWERVLAGATLVQGYSGFIYGGPGWPRALHAGLARRLAASPHTTLADAVGADVRSSRP
ncbi:quinone-dependent dihydroorotate dehydrogenase [Streptomyces sp. 3MP-14]|uniref:Dihydroorotate dehydrogenase (quinone) n=1 Tax=Streptomyces mimosae TaxID=2586635 RepID=A0A5N6A3T6_9ACTN|nr:MULTISPECIES: quinone-dependent dihydroorotate dehydrogenase [Streptomyces]KAB8162619.1 quinone-dependent dihydroorotate dehydrogenase [Streptomyces mimosae]KAB8174446.1 quinone-dependent dihydroorotate dehydrogenase [Streptomyces sp. 3MP-14]